MKFNRLFASLCLFLLLFTACTGSSASKQNKQPRIVNIVNFIRQSEPRLEEVTEEVLYQTVVEQVKQLNKHQLKGTFLLQYDALINPKYQHLLKEELYPGSEIGGWWEITQPHVEAAGITWRGEYSWFWHADVGFSTGYTPQEREKLVDVYMVKFKEIFGYYPKSVGSWFIDAHTLQYMYDKYHIVASCNCKDQYGTDGYTMWGGYWNQAYYPSKVNAYMPAQEEQAQIPVPIFRMLGSDPIYQYDTGVGGRVQGVITLEPVYPDAGGSRKWIEWFFNTMFTEPCLAFNYVQAGQENSFTWKSMKEGLGIQIPLLEEWAQKGTIRVETLAESGKWFKNHYKVTPPTAVTALTDHQNNDLKTVWYNSRYYRTNLLWEGNKLRFRDIHLFDQRIESDYLRQPCTSNQCFYETMPVVDGYLWSTSQKLAGIRFMKINNDGSKEEIEIGTPTVKEIDAKTLKVTCSLQEGDWTLFLKEDQIEVKASNISFDWCLELTTDIQAQLPFKTIEEKTISAEHRHHSYQIVLKKGRFEKGAEAGHAWSLHPEKQTIVFNCNLLYS